MITIIPLAVIIIGLGVILIIASRHYKQALTLDVADLPEEKEARLKSSLLEQRVFRKFYGAGQILSRIFSPLAKAAGSFYRRLQNRLKALERFYRFHSSSPLPDSNGKTEVKLNELKDCALAALESGDWRKAEQSFLAILKINPNEPEAYEGLGKTYLKMESWDEAAETFSYVNKQWPERDLAYASLGAIAAQSGKWEQAKDHYLHALSINNEVVDYHSRLAEIYLELDEKEKALSSLQKAQALEPNNPRLLDQLLQVCIIVKNKDLAQEVLQKIKTANPDHGKLGDLEKKVGEI